MKTLRLRRSPATLALIAAFLLGLTTARGQTLDVGMRCPELSGQDQHEQSYSTDGAQRVLISFDMGPGKKANAYFEKQGAHYLPDHHAVFVANIHGMPGVGRFFAIPKMQKYPHRILLADEKGLLDPFPQEKGKLTILTLDEQGVIETIAYWDPGSGAAPF